MIVLNVEEYCDSCEDFTPEVISPTRVYVNFDEERCLTDTKVQCKYRKRCGFIVRYLSRKLKETSPD